VNSVVSLVAAVLCLALYQQTLSSDSTLTVLCSILGHANPFTSILTSLTIGKDELKYFDLTKLEDGRYGNFHFCSLMQFLSRC